MHGRVGWDRVDHRRYRAGHNPRAFQCGGGKPDTVFHRIPTVVVDPDDRRGTVDHVLQRRAIDGFELWFAIELRRGHFHRAFLDCRGLRDGRSNRGFLGLWRAGDRGFDVLFRAVVGNGGEVCRQFVCWGKCPGAVHVAGAEPATGNQHVTVLITDLLEDVPGGIAHV